jgi:hypothetical protein
MRARIERITLLALLAIGVCTLAPPEIASAAHHDSGACKKKKKKKKKTEEDQPKETGQERGEGGESAEGDEPGAEPKRSEEKNGEDKDEESKSEDRRIEEKRSPEEEQKRVEQAKKKLATEGRKLSQITPGTASRWSNRGAMTPIVAEVPVTAPLPERAIPVPAGTVETPGQLLTGNEEVLQARLYFFAYHLATSGQDQVIHDLPSVQPLGTTVIVPGVSRTFDLYRGRASLAYEHIANGNLGAHLDLEYRTKSSGDVPTDHRINEAYLSWGLVDFRKGGGPDFGVALGRVAIREAGYAQADGAALRLRLGPDFNFGAFGGVTGNPYGYNWLLAQNEEFSTKWVRGGAFVAYRAPRVFANASGVLTYANIGSGRSGLDRAYFYVDAAYLATETLNIFATGFLDVVGGLPIQNVNVVASYSPTDDFNIRFSAGRFSTIVYDISTAYTFAIDRFGNRGGLTNPNAVIVDENGQPIVPFDAVRATTIYNDFNLSLGYRPIRELEVYGSGEVLIRDTTMSDRANTATVGAALKFSSLRIQPSAGVRYRNPALLDANAQLTYIIDDNSQARAFIAAGVGRGWEGLYAMLDARYIFGTIPGLDGGFELTYVFPREWFPGRLMARATFRYYRESLALDRPALMPLPMAAGPPNQVVAGTTTPIQAQESILGLLGVEWRF